MSERLRQALGLALLLLLAGACGSRSQATRPSVSGALEAGASAVARDTPAGAADIPAQLPAFSHVFIIIMENDEYTTTIGNGAAPDINSLAKRYALAGQYYAIAHPSLPNYLALTGGATFGVTSDCNRCFVDATNIADQVEASGRTWRAYMESMPSPCFLGDASRYAQKHNPFLYYDDIRTNTSRCKAHVVPFTQFDKDLAGESPPNYVWISPNACNDMHDCSIGTGDRWLAQHVPVILKSRAFQDDGVLFITWDEGSTDAGCCSAAGSGRVSTLVISPAVKSAFQSSMTETHYSLLRTIEDAWGLSPLGGAGQSSPMTEYFNPSSR
jgi:hypothetical protein